MILRPYNQKLFGFFLMVIMSACVFGGQMDEVREPVDGKCADARFTGDNCDQCANPIFTGAKCEECANPVFAGANCDECANPIFTGANCDECANPIFTGANCDECADGRFTGANCDQCSERFTGANCDQCSERFTGANCDQASANYQMSLGIVWLQSSANNLYFMKTEVTVAQYEACVTAGSCTSRNHSTSSTSICNYGIASRSDHPMNCVTWSGAVEYCTWVGAGLPSDIEWYEEASNNDSRDYPWGDTPQVSCTHSVMDDSSSGGRGCGNGTTMPVGSKPLGDSVSGLSDMSGNVWEWTRSARGGRRLIRGGSWWNEFESDLQASAFRFLTSDSWVGTTGFRCVSETVP